MQLAALEVQRSAFSDKREREREKWADPKTKELVAVTPDEIEEEKLRRKEIARLRMELYGERMGAYALNPAWDDVVPIPVEDGEGALAAIAYPEDYAEGLFMVPEETGGLDADKPQPFPTSEPSWPKRSTRRAVSASQRTSSP